MITKYLNKIVKGDCLNILKKLPDSSIDMAFADPPFNLNKRYLSYVDKKTETEYLEWSRQWLEELIRVIKPTGTIFIHNIPRWLIRYAQVLERKAYFQHWVVWDSLARPCKNTLLPAHYGILMYTKENKGFTFNPVRSPHKLCPKCQCYLKDYGNKPRHPFGPLLSDIWSDISRVQNKKLREKHPCPLPAKLLERVVLLASNPDDIILDPFCGTGTTAVVAKQLGRKFIGIELDPNYVRFARKRLNAIASGDFKPKYHQLA